MTTINKIKTLGQNTPITTKFRAIIQAMETILQEKFNGEQSSD
jgi:hypothetical protein